MSKKIKLIIILMMIYLLISCSKDGYRVEGNRVIYEMPWNEGHGTVIKTLKADPNTFKILGNDNLNWAKDKSKVFWGYIYLDFMDSQSFEVLSVAFAKDATHVICGEDIINEANPEDFKLRNYIENGKEKTYGVDKQAAYLCSEEPNGYLRLPSDSINNFEPIGKNYFKDDEKISWGSRILHNVDIIKFKILDGGYATDGKYVFYTYDIVEGADVSTFKVVKKNYGKDKNNRYYLGRKINRE